MRPSLAQLEALLWIHRLGGFRAAARRLGVTQPALSQRIHELERAVGIPVLQRTRTRPLPTATGRDLLAYAERMVALAEEMDRSVAGRDAVAGNLKLGAADSFATTCLPQLLVEIGAKYPALSIDVAVDYSAELDQRLQRGDLDLAILTAPRITDAINVEPFVELTLRWVAAPALLSATRRLGPRDLVDVPIVTNPSPSHLFSTVRNWFATAGVTPRRLNTCNSLTIMARLAAGGAGISLVPPAIVRGELADGSLRLLRTAPSLAPHHMMLATRRDAPQHLVHAVVGLLKPLARQGALAPRPGDRS
ncbi:MAG: LysR family transcriptional regulator [Alphaproteobacteria bacterium]|nr:LysR family transcriptional regulator [Alphaproteobacteria bacterium]